ncbi:hypothetical protein BC831DRAFT_422468 [Entophlyctis helioformis]|nr:hypothetical protein BC831DRAFT_422468 [Entophlyctis helioformis]
MTTTLEPQTVQPSDAATAAAAPEKTVAGETADAAYVPLDATGFVKKRILAAGTGPQPSRQGTTVRVHYTGSLHTTGEVFDSSVTRGDPLSFRIGEGQVIKGWDIGIASMHVGEKAELLIDAEYGYGSRGSPPKIPGGATLVFAVELVSMDISTAQQTVAEKIAAAGPLKDEGNTLFKQSDFDNATAAYQNALSLLDHTWGADPDESVAIKQLKLTLHANLAAVALKTKNCEYALENCNKALEIDEHHAKALYRMSQALLGLSKFDEAASVLQNNKQFIKDADVDAEVAKIRRAQQTAHAREKQMYSKMFQ